MNTPKRIIFTFLLLPFLFTCGGSDGGGELPGVGDYTVRYEVVGGSGMINEADITYTDANGMEQTIADAPIPWEYSFLAMPDATLLLTAVLHGTGTTTLYTTITIDDTCWIEQRTFLAESTISVSGTPDEILTACPNHGGTTVD